MNDYKIALLCNAYSTNSECFTLPMGVLVETIYGNGNMRISLPGTNCMASGSITPLPMNLLDSLTVHAKMRQSIQFAFFFLKKKKVNPYVINFQYGNIPMLENAMYRSPALYHKCVTCMCVFLTEKYFLFPQSDSQHSYKGN